MEVNITTVTATRLWSKTLSRLYTKTKALENEIELLNLKDDYCEVLQVIFHDENGWENEGDGFIEAESKKIKGRIKQIIMKVPRGFSFKRDGSEDSEIFKAVLERTIIAIQKSHLTPTNKQIIEETIRKYL
jgi:hypothetical protein